MKLRKSFIPIFLVLILTGAAALLGAQVKGDKPLEYAHLMSKAKNEGLVRVIVKMDVPDIHRLTAECNRFNTGNSDTALAQGALDADLNLDMAISAAADRVLCELNGKEYEINRTYSTLPYLALTLSYEALVQLKNLPGVLTIVEDRPMPLPETWKDDPVDGISHPQLNASRQIVGADDAWSLGYDGKTWYVAVLDSGIRKSHEFFKGKEVVEQCFSLEKDCPNGQREMSGNGAAAHIEDRFDHGTHVTGIAVGNNKKDMYGIARGAYIIAVQIFSYIASWDDIGSYYSDQVKGLEFVYQKRNKYKIAAVNMSLGGATQYNNPCDSDNIAQKNAIDNLKAVGIATVAAAGNRVGSENICSGIIAPSCISSAVSVGATTKEDAQANFSFYSNNLLDLFAPGVGIISSIGDADTNYGSDNGTSMAAPHVAGAWAILKQFDASLSVSDALKILKDKGTRINNRCDSSKKPRLDIGEAIMSLLSLAPPLNFSGNQQVNRSLLQTEYINILTWETNPLNAQNNQDIVNYRIYTVDSSDNLNFLVEVSANTFEYWHRKVEKDTPYTYAIKSINDKGEDSIPAYATVE